VKIVVAITGASGALYAQRLLDNLDPAEHFPEAACFSNSSLINSP
jgi:3-polyprenyl-4-hydroxybenzoate decarboxylase